MAPVEGIIFFAFFVLYNQKSIIEREVFEKATQLQSVKVVVVWGDEDCILGRTVQIAYQLLVSDQVAVYLFAQFRCVFGSGLVDGKVLYGVVYRLVVEISNREV